MRRIVCIVIRSDHNTVAQCYLKSLLIHISSYCIDCCECNLFYIPCSEFHCDKDVTKTFRHKCEPKTSLNENVPIMVMSRTLSGWYSIS